MTIQRHEATFGVLETDVQGTEKGSLIYAQKSVFPLCVLLRLRSRSARRNLTVMRLLLASSCLANATINSHSISSFRPLSRRKSVMLSFSGPMIAAALSAAGHRTGLFTSPHLYRVEERMAVDGCPCSGDELAELVEQVRPAIGGDTLVAEP